MAGDSLKFAQTSDLHLGAALRGGSLGLPEDLARIREAELRQALVEFVDVSIEESVDLVLMPGDLFDMPSPSADLLGFLIEQVNRLHPRPTMLCAGNHDPYSRTSAYNRRSALYVERPASAPRWLPHVHIFETPGLAAKDLGRVRVAGCSYYADASLEESPLQFAPRPSRDAAFNVLLFHGAQVLPGLAATDEPQTAPFTAEMLAAAGYDYAAVGHYHAPRMILGPSGEPLGAYAGSPLALAANQTGERGFYIGSLRAAQRAGERARLEELRFVRTDPRQVRRVEVDVTGMTAPEHLAAALERALAEARNEDIVCLRLTGRRARGFRPDLPERAAERFFLLAFENLTTSDYDIPFGQPPPDAPARDVVALFTQRMMRRYLDARDEDERRCVREAAAYGLDALTRGEVTLR